VKNDQVAAAAFLGCFFGFAGTSDFQRSYMFSGWEKTLNVLNVSQFATGIPTSSTKAAKSFCGATAFIGLVGQSYASGMCGIFYGCCRSIFCSEIYPIFRPPPSGPRHLQYFQRLFSSSLKM
jgi:hypothetical protein